MSSMLVDDEKFLLNQVAYYNCVTECFINENEDQ